jgi:hypothetical protein
MFRTSRVAVALVVCTLWGCAPENSAPAVKTIPVSGTVVDKSDKPISGGMLSLRSTTNPEVVASAVIEDDGKFTLSCVVGDKKVDGAQAGEYSVMFAPDTISQNDQPVTLKKTYAIKEGQSELNIKVE